MSIPEPEVGGSLVVPGIPSPPMSPGWAESWQRSWDQLEENLVSDRELRLGVLLDVVEAMVGSAPTVIDLAWA